MFIELTHDYDDGEFKTLEEYERGDNKEEELSKVLVNVCHIQRVIPRTLKFKDDLGEPFWQRKGAKVYLQNEYRLEVRESYEFIQFHINDRIIKLMKET